MVIVFVNRRHTIVAGWVIGLSILTAFAWVGALAPGDLKYVVGYFCGCYICGYSRNWRKFVHGNFCTACNQRFDPREGHWKVNGRTHCPACWEVYFAKMQAKLAPRAE